MFGLDLDPSKLLSDLVNKVQTEVPDAIHRQATAMNLADNAMAAVIKQAVHATLEPLLKSGLGGQASSLLGGVSSLLGSAQSLGVDKLIQRALDSTDIDERLRDALIDGFARYLKDNAGRLAQVALAALRDAGKAAT
ncbi:MAG: hypothetical protein U1A78_10315 [Polyangia bacterium]